MYSTLVKINKSWRTVCEGEEGSGTPPADIKPEETKTAEEIAFNERQQSYINNLLANERRKGEKAVKDTIAELEALQKKSTLTANEKQDLEARISTLQATIMTKEEIAKKEAAKLQHEKETEVARLTADVDFWRKSYTESTIERAIIDAAGTHKAHNPNQLVGLLRHSTTLEPVVAEDGSTTGKFSPVTKYDDIDTSGNPVTYTLPVHEAVKRMSESEYWANLFRGKGSSGIGQSGSVPSGTNMNLWKTDQKAFNEAREKGLIK